MKNNIEVNEKKIVKNTSMLYLLNIAKIVFPLITLPYLTRVLSVETYGMVAYVKAFMQYMQLVVDFGFLLSGTKDIALALGDQQKINHEVGDIFIARILLCVVAFIALMIAALFIPILGQNLLYTILSYGSVFLTVFLMDFYFRGIERMEIITIRFVVMRGVAALLTFVFVKSDADILWIPILSIVGSLMAIILVWFQLRKLNVKISPQGLIPALRKLKESFVYFASNMATTAFNALNTLLIGIFLDPTSVAYWSICIQMIGAVQAFYTPIAGGIYPQMVRTKKRSLLQKIIKIFIPIILSGCVITLVFAKYVLLIVAGEKYVEAVNVLRILTPVMLFSFPAILYGWPALGAINKQKQTSATTIISAVFQVSVLVILIAFGNFNLISIAIVRSLTEIMLFATRFSVYWKNRQEFA
ncbi:oligosaccharide flippase family protein [bacterium]|nr:oligosaccharide flippase family protein [bacterium]